MFKKSRFSPLVVGIFELGVAVRLSPLKEFRAQSGALGNPLALGLLPTLQSSGFELARFYFDATKPSTVVPASLRIVIRRCRFGLRSANYIVKGTAVIAD